MLGDVVRTNFQKLIFEVFHVLHCAFIKNIDAEVILDKNLFVFLIDLIMIYSAKQSNTLVTDMLLATHPFKFNINRLKLHWLSES